MITFLKYWWKIKAETKVLEAAALNLDSFLRYFYQYHLRHRSIQNYQTSVSSLHGLDRHVVTAIAMKFSFACTDRLQGEEETSRIPHLGIGSG